MTGAFLSSSAYAQQPVNLALGQKVLFDAKPNYAYCTGPDDEKQLTDGLYSGFATQQEGSRSIWVQKSTVGWQYIKPTIITIDLGSRQPIAGVSFSTGAGTAGVTWPTAIYVAVSDDDKNWRAVGDLVPLSRKNGKPPVEGYAPFRYVTHDLHATGRYISFSIVAVPFVFSDEIEVYKGDDAWLQEPVGEFPISSLKQYAADSVVTASTQRRIYNDIDSLERLIAAANIPAQRKQALTARLELASKQAATLPLLPKEFKTILPLNDIHRDVLATHGELLASQGIKPLTVWKKHRYAPLILWHKPTGDESPSLQFSMLRQQFRSDAILLTNASSQVQNVTLQLKNVPQAAQDGWLQCYSVAWTDTEDGIPVADALLPLAGNNGNYSVEVPAGMTRKVWFLVDSSKIPSGNYRSTVEVTSGQQHVSVPLTLDISKTTMNKPRVSLTMWDYTNSGGLYSMKTPNIPSAIALMRSHHVDTPWATALVLALPDSNVFDSSHRLKTKLDFNHLDSWIASWRGARRYFVYANVPDSFAGYKIGTPEFNQRVGNWAKALSAHIVALGLKPQQLGILLVDEPHREEQDAIIAGWAKAINAAAPELTLFSDPRWKRPDQTKNQDALTEMDILCPALGTYNSGGSAVQKYFQYLRAGGHELWFYQTNGPTRKLDPQLYYRYQTWHAFAAGATGSGFWSFGDTGKAPTSWNDYSASGINYAPAYVDKETVYSSSRWEAVREGVEDYEVLAMLQDAINRSGNASWQSRAKQVLNEAVNAVTSIWQPGDYTKDNTNPALADIQRQKVLDMLSTAPQ